MDTKKIQFLKNLSTWLVVAAVVFAFMIAGIRIFGVQVYGVLTGSMEPTYPTGSLIYVKPVDASDLRVNDVITFSISPNVIATHRIVEIVPDENYPTIMRYRTKGDANKDVDASLVSANNIIGKALFAVPQLGYLASYIQEPPGIYVAIFVCGLMIAFVFYTDSLDSKQKGSAQNAPASEKKSFDLRAYVNQMSQKLLGKPLFKEKEPVEPVFQQGYTVQAPVQQPVQYGMQQQYYPQQGQYPPQMQQYPQQAYPWQQYPQQMPQQPGYGAQQYPQGYPQQGYPVQDPRPLNSYPQQGQYSPQMQQYPQQTYPQQQYYAQQGYVQQQSQQAYPVQQNGQQGYPRQDAYPQQRNS